MRIKKPFDKDKVFFTSDTHFHHTNIIEFCNRPFGDVRTMDSALLANWNKVVPKDGHVFHLGDFIWTDNLGYIQEIIKKLNGTMYLCLGNHDYKNKLDRDAVKEMLDGHLYDVLTIEVDDNELEDDKAVFFMSHYPHMYWQRNTTHLHGHVHSGPGSTSSELVPDHNFRYDVGVDNNNFAPISYHDLKVKLTKRSINYEE